MSAIPSTEPPPLIGQARRALLRRLIDVVALPSSLIAPPDRAMAGDVLLDMLFEADDEQRRFCAVRLAHALEAPRRVLRYLAQCAVEVAQPLLQECEAFDASDLADIVQNARAEHRAMIAARRNLCSTVSDLLIRQGEPFVVRALLRNPHAKLSETGIDELLVRSQDDEELTGLIARRTELRPSQAMVMFWWSDGPTRREILLRQSADRMEMIERCADVFPMAAAENWADPVVRKTLQLIERRQRNRAALGQSPYDSLEHAIEVAAAEGMSPKLAQEIGYLSGVKPVTIAKILSDTGGEGVAVLCKATGLKLPSLEQIWTALRRPFKHSDGTESLNWRSVVETYDLLSVARAQTTLRYWNWSLSSAFSPRLRLISPTAGDETGATGYSAPQRTARLLFARDKGD